jgi:hypothetical protein
MLFLLSVLLTSVATVTASLPPAPQYPGLRLTYENDFNDGLRDFTARDNYVQTPYAEACCACSRVRRPVAPPT